MNVITTLVSVKMGTGKKPGNTISHLHSEKHTWSGCVASCKSETKPISSAFVHDSQSEPGSLLEGNVKRWYHITYIFFSFISDVLLMTCPNGKHLRISKLVPEWYPISIIPYSLYCQIY